MKRVWLTAILALLFVFAFAGCGDIEESNSAGSVSNVTSTTEEATEASSEVETETTTAGGDVGNGGEDFAIPAFAADPVGSKEGPAITEMTFDKIVQADEDTYQPQESISFTVSPANPVDGETAGDPSIPVVAGETGGASFDAPITTDPTKQGDQTYQGKFKFDKSKFKQPGIYKYRVTENALANNPDMKLAADQYLYVYVRRPVNQTECEVYAASLMDTDQNAENKKSGAFTNEYKTSGNTNDEFKDLTITKTVTGTQGDTSKYFNFKLTITSGSNRKFYEVSNVADNTEEGKTKVESGVEYTFKLHSGQSIVIENLSTNDTYTITEDEAGQDGYKTTGQVGTAKNMINEDIEEIITNEKNAVNPTGIFMSYGPYIAMIVAAAVLAFVFLRRREEI